MLLKASAPGSLMLLGEYAVLHGKHALVCAIDKRMTVTLKPRQDQKIFLESALGRHETTLNALQVAAPFQFVLAALKSFKKYFQAGCEIKIESEFSSTIGFASSAAVTVATVAVLAHWFQLTYTEQDLIRHARKIVRAVQGLGSGADVAACVLGGMVAYRMRPLSAIRLPNTYPMTVVYSGSKTPTVTAVNLIEKKFSTEPKLFSSLLECINQCVIAGIDAVKQNDWPRLGELLNIQQGLMDALGVNTEKLNAIIERLRALPSILGAKISGSGLGDCVVGLGETNAPFALASDASEIKVKIANRGVYCEEA